MALIATIMVAFLMAAAIHSHYEAKHERQREHRAAIRERVTLAAAWTKHTALALITEAKNRADAQAAAEAAVEAQRIEAEKRAQELANLEASQAMLNDTIWQEAGAIVAATPSPASAAPAPSGDLESYVREAAATFGQSFDDMWRVAGCESTWGQDPNAYNGNSGHYGPFQFKVGTWATTPYAEYDINNDYYNSMAAGWMWANGRRGEWQCQ